MVHDRAVICECSSLYTAVVRTKAQRPNVIGVAQVGVTLFFRYEDFKFT
jgi:hypothetical protein